MALHPWKHFKTITYHRFLVMKYCFRVGLYKQGLLHDLSKYSPTEFWVGVRYYQGNRSPNNAEIEDRGYSSSWLHHKGRNKHHYEYWVDHAPKGALVGWTQVKMPVRYVVEMLMDRIAACQVYQGEQYTDEAPLAYFQKSRDAALMHPDTVKLLEALMRMLADQGSSKTFAYIREKVL